MPVGRRLPIALLLAAAVGGTMGPGCRPDGVAPAERQPESVRAALSGTTTPAPTANWSSSGSGDQDLSRDSGFWGDAQVAGSTSHVVVTQRASLGFFTRQGTQLAHVSGASFFAGGLPSGATGVFDLWTIFDRYRKRFWILGMADSEPPGNGLLLIAVSKTENPTDGWFRYNWNGQVPGATGRIGFPNIAISADAFMVANDGGAGSIWRFFPADQMASGAANLTGFAAYWNIRNQDGSAVEFVQPAMLHDGTAADRHFAVTRYGPRGLTVLAVTNPLSTSRAFSQADVQLPSFLRNAFEPGTHIGAPQKGTSFPIGMYPSEGASRTPAM